MSENIYEVVCKYNITHGIAVWAYAEAWNEFG
jgi:hypothetical protein